MINHQNQILIAQKKLTLLLGSLGMAMPCILYLGNLWVFGVDQPLYALSTYYHSGMRDVFVGILFAFGVFLITYEGEKRIDRVIATLAGIMAISVALIPTHPPRTTPGITSDLHNYAAASFYGLLAYFCLYRFIEIDLSRSDRDPSIQKKIRASIYFICGLIMFIVLIALVTISLFNISITIQNYAFWLEYIANISFGFAFFVKSEGIFILNDDAIGEMNPWEIYGITLLSILIIANAYVLTQIFIYQ